MPRLLSRLGGPLLFLILLPQLAAGQLTDSVLYQRLLHANRSSPGAAKTTAMKSRIIASTGYITLNSTTDSLWNPDSTSTRYAKYRLSGATDTSLYFYRKGGAGKPFQLSSRGFATYNRGSGKIERTSETLTGSTWTPSTYRNRFFPDASGRDTLSYSDTFGKAAGSYQPYTETRSRFVNSSILTPLWSSFAYWNKTSGTYQLSSISRASFNAAGSRTGREYQFWTNGKPDTTNNGSRDTLVYSVTNKLLMQRSQDLRSGVWVTTDSVSNNYDASDNPVLQFHFSTSSGTRPLNDLSTQHSSFDARGNCLRLLDSSFDARTGSFISEMRYDYEYDVVDSTVSIRSQFTNKIFSSADSSRYDYDVAGRTVSYRKYTLRQGRWVPLAANIRTFGADVDSFIFQTGRNFGDTLYNNTLNVYRRDSLGRQVQVLYYTWLDSAWSLRNNGYDNRYYYEVYDDSLVESLAVAEVLPAGSPELKLYPVPAADALSMEFQMEAHGRFEVDVFSTAGELIGRWESTGEGRVRRRIRLPDVRSGIYTLRIRTVAGTRTARFAIQR